MNKNFDELAAAWRVNVAAGTKQEQREAALPDLVSRLRAFEKRQLRINLAKTVAVTAIMASLVWIMLQRPMQTVLMQIGLLTIAVSTVIFVTYYWRMQFKISSLNMNASARGFIGEAIEKLNKQKQLFRIYFPAFVFFLILGLNIVTYDMFESIGVSQRALNHLKLSAPILVIYFLAKQIRQRRFAKEFQPVIDNLASIAEEFDVTEAHSERDNPM
jgi:hypothetical protein